MIVPFKAHIWADLKQFGTIFQRDNLNQEKGNLRLEVGKTLSLDYLRSFGIFVVAMFFFPS